MSFIPALFNLYKNHCLVYLIHSVLMSILFEPLNYKVQTSARFQFEDTRNDTWDGFSFILSWYDPGNIVALNDHLVSMYQIR
jgi:hypothetical protein